MRYSLRLVLVLLAFLAIPLSWIANRAINQRYVVSVVERNGGLVYFDYGEDDVDWTLPIAETESSQIQILCSDITEISLDFRYYDEKLKSSLRELRRLHFIQITGPDKDFGIAVVKQDFPHLDVSNLPGSQYAWYGKHCFRDN